MNLQICSRAALEDMLAHGLPQNAAIISFCDPVGVGRHRHDGYAPIDFRGKCDRVIQIAARDLDPEALPKFGLSVEEYLPEADELADFILQAVADGCPVICQCEYGQSRSAACAAAILKYFEGRGIDIFADYRYYPNQLVYHKVYDALKKRARIKQ